MCILFCRVILCGALAMWGMLFGTYQVALIGILDDLCSLTRHTTSFIDCLYQEKDIQLKLFKNPVGKDKDLAPQVRALSGKGVRACTKKDISDYLKHNKPVSGVVIHTNSLDESCAYFHKFDQLLSKQAICIASSVYETTAIPTWKVEGFNACCDAVIVPDAWLVDVYKKSGVTCPIFVLPLVLDLTSLLARPLKKQPSEQFTFGFSGLFFASGRKNHERLMESFAQEFGGIKNVALKLHGRAKRGDTFHEIFKQFDGLKTANISLACNSFSRQAYEDFLASLDCYVSVAKGEGFSIIPREILALGIPCILANNTAQQTVCAAGFVRAVPSNSVEKAHILAGNWFNTPVQDVRSALRDVYENYGYYLAKAHEGREWVKQYQAQNLVQQYRSLVAPQIVILGNRNELGDDYLMTDSPQLFERYKVALKGTPTQFRRTK